MLTALVVVAVGAFGALPQVVWFTAYDAQQGKVTVPETGKWGVWLQGSAVRGAEGTVAGQKVTATMEEVRKRLKDENKSAWGHAADMDLQQGKLEVALGKEVSGIMLSKIDGFKPGTFQHDVFASEQPGMIHDARATQIKHTDTVFSMPTFSSVQEWETLAERLRTRLAISSGLYPMPEKTPLNAKITGRIEHPDYSVEKVSIEARPGFLVTGNLYRPTGKGPFPGVACPHGHWKEGRLENAELGSVPARCITMARMGMVVFSYDMIGYNDSLQFEHNWGGELEKLWGIHPFAMQLWSSIRVVDFLQSLPDVDKERIGCTGASGGGTQTFALSAIDARVKVCAPVNMISHTMQGGCLCENAPIIRMENSNMEIGALMAPRPMLMVAATGDWTRETPHIEYPAVRSIYKLYGVEDHVETEQFDFPHNFNQPSREAVYRFMGKWLLGDKTKWVDFKEPPYELEKTEDLRVFPDKQLPAGLPNSRQILDNIRATDRDKWNALMPKDATQLASFREKHGKVLSLTTGCTPPAPNDLSMERLGFEERRENGYAVEGWVLHRKGVNDAVPTILYRPIDANPCDAVLVVHGKGKAALADAVAGGPGPLVKSLLSQGKAVMAIDTFLLGEHQGPDAPAERVVIGKFGDTFQPTDTGCRIQDVLTALAYLRTRGDLNGHISVVGLDEGGIWSLFASAIDGNVATTIVDANQFDVENDQAWVDRFYIPCIRTIGDVRTAAVLVAPRRLEVWNAAPSFAQAMNDSVRVVNTASFVLKEGVPVDAALLETLH